MFKPERQPTALIGLITALVVSVGCNEQNPGTTHATANTAQTKRVVSLAPALSQMIVDLGQEQLLVGVAQYDDAAPAHLPVVGHWQDINTEALLSLRPTHVLTMIGQAAPTPAHLARLARWAGFEVLAYPCPTQVTDIITVLVDQRASTPDSNGGRTESLGHVLGVPGAAQRVVNRIQHVLTQLRQITIDAPKRRVLLVIGVAPWMASGPGNILDELLSVCGASNAAGDAVVGAPIYDKEKLLEANPDVILLLLPNAPALGTIRTDPRLALLQGLAITAVEQERVVLINDPLVHLPASSVTRVALAMAKAIHPQLGHKLEPLLAAESTQSITLSSHRRSDSQ